MKYANDFTWWEHYLKFLCKSTHTKLALEVIHSMFLDQNRFWLIVTPKYSIFGVGNFIDNTVVNTVSGV